MDLRKVREFTHFEDRRERRLATRQLKVDDILYMGIELVLYCYISTFLDRLGI